MATFQFVDSISSTPTVRLDLNTFPWMVKDGFDLSPAPVRRAVSSTLLAHGELISAAAWGNRTLQIPVQLLTSTPDEAATAIQQLARELSRETNILKVQFGSQPYFFRTFFAPDFTYAMPKLLMNLGQATLEIPAEPFAYGLKETLPTVTVSNDPDEGLTLNSNPYFETDASNWSVVGGTFVRSNLQAHQGTWSGLLTPNGVATDVTVESEHVTGIVPGVRYRVAAWVRCAVARTIDIHILWFDASDVQLSTSGVGVAVSATTWTQLSTSAAAPASAARASLRIRMTGTPPGSNTLHVDEARLWQPGTAGGACFDLTGVKGDVETPLVLRRSTTFQGQQSLFAVRRDGTPNNTPFLAQAEAWTQGADTTTQTNSATFSGAGNNYSRCTFATAAWTARLTTNPHPPVASVDARGTYRVFARVRKNGTTGTVQIRLAYGGANAIVDGDPVTVSWTSPAMADLGLMSIPVGSDPTYDGFSGTELAARGIFVALEAQRTSGTDTLDIDYLLFIPADDRLAIVNWTDNAGSADALVLDGVHELSYGTLVATGEVVSMTPGWHVGGLPMLSPNTNNRVFFVNEVKPAQAEPAFPTTFTLTAWYWPRYLYVRPATT